MQSVPQTIVVATRQSPERATVTIRLSDGRRTDVTYSTQSEGLAEIERRGASSELLSMVADAMVSAERVYSF